jgi:hypothetical protein
MGEQEKHSHEDDLETYEYSGIQVRHGKVPGWLIVVYAALGIWGVYYLWAYWTHF